MIKGIKDNFCKYIQDFEANALYSFLFSQKMLTGWYRVQNETDGYKKHKRYSKQSIKLLDHLMKTRNIFIQHAENRGELRIENHTVNGYNEKK